MVEDALDAARKEFEEAKDQLRLANERLSSARGKLADAIASSIGVKVGTIIREKSGWSSGFDGRCRVKEWKLWWSDELRLAVNRQLKSGEYGKRVYYAYSNKLEVIDE